MALTQEQLYNVTARYVEKYLKDRGVDFDPADPKVGIRLDTYHPTIDDLTCLVMDYTSKLLKTSD